MGDLFGRYSGSIRARIAQAAKMISMMILQVKTLVVMKGKKRDEETRNGMKGMMKRPERIKKRNVCLFIASIVPLY